MLLVGEVIIRILYKDSIALFPRYQTDVRYGDFTIRRTRPNMTYTHTSIDGTFDFISNNKGFRNSKDIAYQKDSDEIRILFLGDSQVLGYEVKQSQVLTTKVEEIFKEQNIKVTAINTGVSGFGTAEELALLENEGYKYKPDFVVLGFDINDFRNNLISNLFKIENDSLVVNNLSYVPGTKIQNAIYKYRIFHFLGENSYLYTYAFNAVWEGVKEMRYKDLDEKKANALTEFVLEDRKEFSNYENALMRKLISRMYNYCKSNEIPLIIFDIPTLYFSSSIPPDLTETFKNNSDTLFHVPDLMEDFSKLDKVHVRHGHRHMSEETHNLFAHKISEYVREYLDSSRVK